MKKIYSIALFMFFFMGASAQRVIKVAAKSGDATKELQAAIDKARQMNGKPVVIELQNSNYNIYRESSTKLLYHISNTASESENPDQTKHIGLLFKGLKNIEVNGNGAKLITHGEMTSFVIDECENITLRNFTIDAADPTVPELTVTELANNYMIVEINPQSKYEIKEGKFSFVGDSWTLSAGIAQSYDPRRDVTWRSWSPLDGLLSATELAPNKLLFLYAKRPEASVGTTFQMRDAIRDEACGLIQYSRNTLLEGIHFAFLGNFGVVGQMSENITCRNLTFEPESGSGRTGSGLADFVQMSGCKGLLLIENSRFSGAHDDPINIHGTHLQVVGFPANNQAIVKYMHSQSYGFQSFCAGDQVEFINPNSLISLAAGKVKSAEMRGTREIIITFEKTLPQALLDNRNLVVENVTYTPQVEIRGNYFSRIPTRGILVTTRRKVLIENNTFFRMQMSGILIADDARSWFESGMVRDVTIRHNNFIECGSPVINISPENNMNEGFVHRNITITANRFKLGGGQAISAKSVNGLSVTDNLFMSVNPVKIEDIVKTTDCQNVIIKNNILQ